MRLIGLELENFRSYRDPRLFECGGDAIVLIGPNGYGKTSFFDSIGWCLFGDIQRIRGTRDAVTEEYVLNHFAEKGASPRVTLHFAEGDRRVSFERRGRKLTVVENGVTLSKAEREWLIREMLPLGHGLPPSSLDAAQSHFYRSFLLGQDQMADFVRETSPRERFDALVGLLGVELVREFYKHEEGLLGSLQVQLDRIEGQELRVSQDLQALREERQELIAQGRPSRKKALTELRQVVERVNLSARRVGIDADADPSEIEETPQLLELVEHLEAEIRISFDEADRELETLRTLVRDWTSTSAARRRLKELSSEEKTLSRSLKAAKARAKVLQGKLREIEDRRREIEEKREPLMEGIDALRQWLVMALDHVSGDRCPLCDQGIRPDTLKRRISRRLEAVPGELADLESARLEAASEARGVRQRLQRQEAKAEELEDAMSALAEDRDTLSESTRQFDALLSLAWDRKTEPRLSDIKRDLSRKQSRLTRLRRLLKNADDATARAHYLASIDRLTEIRARESKLREERRNSAALRRRTVAIDQRLRRIIDSAKRAERSIVSELLERRQPVLSALYKRLRPHPIFDELNVNYRKFAERGEAYFRASSLEGETNIATTFSSAQLNAVAICVFLSLNLGQGTTGLIGAYLDDPIQNMDDFNVLGLLDLLRQVGRDRQLVISTHDVQIGELIRKKLRPSHVGRRTIVHRFVRYDSNGPEFKTEIDEFTPEPFLLERALQASNRP